MSANPSQGYCFGSDRQFKMIDLAGNPIVSKDDAKRKGPFCYVLSDSAFRKMYCSGRCGTKRCPHYKRNRKEIR